ncbi:hypothetical protein A2643_02110 [Candidatus Nomurabacteria bacterium RIFCSPHIGHO2_01_FULL_39_220]|uniref:Nudix hydrolase domain-containing protein n=1 Tax=Candidatus Nomurabacteria bacterium RIFCSPLOWO2_02_FULL_40_67 TaxID=1801787 RepID=A0A1F6Y513_9BACT|nr:MAG: hypothetical protein UU01_C0010G0015 [Parcubacteria group bacterium GW2011_GWA2_40_37]KKS14230.1 MAG: hypothetical protein UU71_C0031G0015 [Parcubacteria group bacterium GW2011_GWB1_41_6]KKS72416.1 MAG: hypothetical protein UV43_C0017G0016 [Parcubacteria group bacterium GW2011_GWF2_42_7]OGI63146.1 MAG: hypothetical protein A2W12_04220 [Candidatus Nomurabacteria bacterium RBG_16_40_11]OGI69892.1 MAG: hypothetical protein A2643_02110 [Candidatus Nomurabacteria bacterium RIFCSPHIGHO2_01_FU
MNKLENIPEFGLKRENEKRRDGGCGVVFDPETQKYAIGLNAKNGAFWLFSGGVNSKEDIKDGVLREITEESGLHNFLYVESIAEALCHYHNILKDVNRIAHATCFLVILENKDLIDTRLEEHEKLTLAWSTSKEIISNWELRNENKGYDHWIYFLKKSVARAQELGYDMASDIRKL